MGIVLIAIILDAVAYKKLATMAKKTSAKGLGGPACGRIKNGTRMTRMLCSAD